jgi:hypothetical protein
MNPLGFSQPFFVVLVEFTLFDVLVELDVISLAKDGKNLVVNLPNSFVGVFDEL